MGRHRLALAGEPRFAPRLPVHALPGAADRVLSWGPGQPWAVRLRRPGQNVVLIRLGTEYNYGRWPDLLAELARCL